MSFWASSCALTPTATESVIPGNSQTKKSRRPSPRSSAVSQGALRFAKAAESGKNGPATSVAVTMRSG